MFRSQDFKKIYLLGTGKKHTRIFKVIHVTTGKVYALKQIEAKSIQKLNEYKQQAVQLMKVQNHPNVVKSYGYFMTDTQYNSYILGIIIEFMDHNTNLQNLYRKRLKQNLFWAEKQLVTMYCSIISTCAFLQDRGICHRDIKPSNLFLLPNNQIKLIDFGESKDYFYDLQDQNKNTYTMATIRGTPQYLSPILWKAHVVDGKSRYAEHNIYKSDVFSTGLVFLQLALMAQVNGFNSKTSQANGEELIKTHLHILQKKYSSQFVQILDILLRFDQSERPSFSEIDKLFMQREQQSKQTSKPCNQYIKFYNEHYSNLRPNIEKIKPSSMSLISNFASKQQIPHKSHQKSRSNNQPANFYKDSTLIQHQSCYWFEFGGTSIGRFSIQKLKWKIDSGSQNKKIFPLHFSVIYIPQLKCYFLLGGPPGQNFRIFQSHKQLVLNKAQMPTFRNFISCLYYNQKVFVFGGYDVNTKKQLNSAQYYDMTKDKWKDISQLKIARSQSAACRINDDNILIFGGYNKQQGTLSSIEKYNINTNTFQLIDLKLPIPLRRFIVVRISNNVALVMGGLTKYSKESQRVFKLDYSKLVFVELEGLEQGGVIENEVLVDQQNYLHIFLEHSNGTSPHSHIKYHYDPAQERYATRFDP